MNLKSIIVGLTVLVLLVLSTYFAPPSFAVTPTINPTTVTENTKTVTVTFDLLQSGRTFYFCFKLSEALCLDNPNGNIKANQTTAANEKVSVTVCGASEKELKTGCSANDYFHPETYRVFLFDEKMDMRSVATFTVARFIPEISMNPKTGFKPNQSITITITGSREPKSLTKRNNYQITIFGENGTPRPSSNEKCLEVINDGSGAESFSPDTGDYRIEVRDQVHENDCDGDGDFRYREYTFTVKDAGGELISEQGSTTSVVGEGSNPCSAAGCETALGLIPTSVKEFAARILGIATGIAGGIALILMVIGSIRVLASSGDPKAVGAGREMIVAAVAGLLFLIFAVLILRFIGINIFKGVPGMGT